MQKQKDTVVIREVLPIDLNHNIMFTQKIYTVKPFQLLQYYTALKFLILKVM